LTVEGTELKRWDARSGRLLDAEPLPGQLNQWAVNPELLVSTSPRGDLVALLLDSTDAKESRRPHQVVVYRFHDGSRAVEHALSPFAAEGAYGIAWSPSADWFAAYGHSSSVVVQAVHDVRITRRLQHDGSRIDDGVRWAAFSQDGRWLVTGSCDRTAKVWDVPSGVLLADLAHPREVCCKRSRIC
jgi:WD40 repeat protein